MSQRFEDRKKGTKNVKNEICFKKKREEKSLKEEEAIE
jgi:hypothetical protein